MSVGERVVGAAEGWRIQLDRTLREQVARAAAAGAGRVHAMFGAAAGIVEIGYADLADRGALRRVRRWRAPQEVTGAAAPQTVTSVDYVVPLHDRSVLVMAFSTLTEPVHRELVALLDAIATTLHRAPERSEQ